MPKKKKSQEQIPVAHAHPVVASTAARVGNGRGPTGGVDRQSGQHAPTGRASLVAAAVRSYGPAADGGDNEDEEAEMSGEAGSASISEHGYPVVASASAAADHNGVSGIAAASTSRRLSSSHDEEEVDDWQAHHVPSALIMGLDEHDDERGKLARALHEATNRVKETYAALKLSLEPLTFAYGEDDGLAYYEKIVNSPDAYRDDRRPAFEQVATAALAHDEAMHWAGVATRELEDFDHQALPVDLLRQVMNQRFRVLEARVRQLEKELRHSLQAKPQDAPACAAPIYEATTEAQAERQPSKQGKIEPPIAAASAVSTSTATTTTTTSREYPTSSSVAEDLLGDAALPSSYAATTPPLVAEAAASAAVPMSSGVAEVKSGSFDEIDESGVMEGSAHDDCDGTNVIDDSNNDEASASSHRPVCVTSKSESASSDASSPAATTTAPAASAASRSENRTALPMAVAAADAVPVNHNNAAMCLRQVQHWRCERVLGPRGAAGVPDAAPSTDTDSSSSEGLASMPSSALNLEHSGDGGLSSVRSNCRDLGRFVVSVVPVFAPVNADPDPEFNAIYQRRANAAVLKRFYDFLCDVLGRRAEAAAAASSWTTVELDNSQVDGAGDGDHNNLLSNDSTKESSQKLCQEEGGHPGSRKLGQQQQLELLWCDGPVRCLNDVRPNQLGLLAAQATANGANSNEKDSSSSVNSIRSSGSTPPTTVEAGSSSARSPALSESFRVLLVGGPVPIGWDEESACNDGHEDPSEDTDCSSRGSSRSGSGSNNHGFEPLVRVLEELSTAFYVKLHDEPGPLSPCKRVQVYC